MCIVEQRVRCIINVPDGPSRRVGDNGLLIGRRHDCDIVSDDPSVSRRHALVRITGNGAELVPIGRGPISVNGKSYDKAMPLCDGDKIGVPGIVLEVKLEARRPAAVAAAWLIERRRGGNFGIVHSPFVLGGGANDDLIIKRWPAAAMRFHVAQGEVYVEATAAKVTRNGVELPRGSVEALAVDDQIEFRKETFVLRQAAHDATTVAAGPPALPTRVAIEMLPRGGRVVFTIGHRDSAVFLADRRLDLLIALLRPPDGHAAGDFVSDEIVGGIVWPRNPGARTDINVLIGRCRGDLVAAGLAGARLIERAPGGGATRIALAPGAVVELTS